MLSSLAIKNFILIEELELNFAKGLCIITGETGAGKSIMLDAILFCLGYNISGAVIRHDSQSCTVMASFSPTPELKNFLVGTLAIQCNEELVINCSLSANNKKKFLINGRVVPQKIVQQTASYLLELHGQNSQIALLNNSKHLDIVDAYGDFTDLKIELASHFKNWRQLERQIAEIDKQKTGLAREIDYLTFTITELENASIKVGEEEHLSDLRRSLQNREKDLQLLGELMSLLDGQEATAPINKALRMISRNNKDSEEGFVRVVQNLEHAYHALEEAETALKVIADRYSADEHNIEEVEERLFLIRKLLKKYAINDVDIFDFLQNSYRQLKDLENRIASSDRLENELKIVREQYSGLAAILSSKRRQAAKKLEQKVQSELKYLKLDRVIFSIKVDNIAAASAQGHDNVEFLASTNPGMPLSPLDKIASGGELSRFMLALKVALFDKASKPTLIFDEIDTGIGGAVADSVGDRLKALSKALQVIVITHQPQVAGKADCHIVVGKTHSEDKTIVNIKRLSDEERVAELARMISGKKITETSLKAARELVN